MLRLSFLTCFLSATDKCIIANFTLSTYCESAVAYPISSTLNITFQDGLARQAYKRDVALWETNREVSCEKQHLHETMCSDCLAIRRFIHCAESFPRCDDDDDNIGMCRFLCHEGRWRCKEDWDCSKLRINNCSTGLLSTIPSSIWMFLVLVTVLLPSS